MIRHGTYNLFNLSQPRTTEEQAQYAARVEVVRGLEVHSLSVQEILAPTMEAACTLLRQFAYDTGLQCMTAPNPVSGEPSVPAVAGSNHGVLDKNGVNRGDYHVGLLWAPGVEAVPGEARAYNGSPDFWHALITQILDFGGTNLKVGSYHGDPFRPDSRFNEAFRVLSAFVDQSGMLGADFNNISADRRNVGWLNRVARRVWPWAGPAYYDPDPLRNGKYHDGIVFQAEWTKKPRKHPRSDRKPTEVFLRAGLLDAAAVLEAPWQWTCGHWPGDMWEHRRIDTTRVTRDVAAALVEHNAIHTDLALQASDHVPVVSTVDESQIPERRVNSASVNRWNRRACRARRRW